MFCFVASNSNINDGKVFCRAQDTEAKIRAFPCLLANIADVSAEGTSKWRGLLLESGVECVCVCVAGQEEAMTVLQALVENTVMEVHVMGVEVEERAEQLPTVELYAQYSSWVSGRNYG